MDHSRNLALLTLFSIFLTCVLKVFQMPVTMTAMNRKRDKQRRTSIHVSKVLALQFSIDIVFMVRAAPPLLSMETFTLLVLTLVNLYMVVGDENDFHGTSETIFVLHQRTAVMEVQGNYGLCVAPCRLHERFATVQEKTSKA